MASGRNNNGCAATTRGLPFPVCVTCRGVPAREVPLQLGEFKVPVRLHKDVTAEVTVQVVKEE